MSAATLARKALKVELGDVLWDIDHAKAIRHQCHLSGALEDEYYFNNMLNRSKRRRDKIQKALKELKQEGKGHAQEVYYSIDIDDFLNWSSGGVPVGGQPTTGT